MRVPFVVYADFEAVVKPIQSCEPSSEKSFTKKYQKHKPCGFGYHIVCFDESHAQEPVIYRAKNEDEDVSQIFVDWLERDFKKTHEEIDFSMKMILTEKDSREFNRAKECWIFEDLLKDDKVRDHRHFTGKYWGAAHRKCNLKFKKPKFTSVIFHNWQIMTLIYSSKTSAKVREISIAFRIMKKNTSASAKRLKLVLIQTEKEKWSQNQEWASFHRQLQVHGFKSR